jgi:predicted nucleic acid-binding protein
MSSPVFVDTSFIIALMTVGDRHHAKALHWQAEIERRNLPLSISTAILLELGDGFHDPREWKRLEPVIEALRVDPAVTVIDADAECFEHAYALRKSRRDKAWGLTDCTSFVIMNHHGIKAALTADQHFVQAGFRALLLE